MRKEKRSEAERNTFQSIEFGEITPESQKSVHIGEFVGPRNKHLRSKISRLFEVDPQDMDEWES